jgi:hypothetical protein
MGATAFQSRAASLHRKHVIPIVLGVAMLAVVIAAVLTPDAGVQAPASSQPSSSSVSLWVYLGVAVVVVVLGGLLLTLFLLRRSPQPAASPTAMPPSPEDSVPPLGPLGVTPSQAPVAAPPPAYPETAQDWGPVPPAAPVAATPAGEAVAAGGRAEAREKSDTRRVWLMAQIDETYRKMAETDPRMRLWERATEPRRSPSESTEPGASHSTRGGSPSDERPDEFTPTLDSSRREEAWIAHTTEAFHIGSRGPKEVRNPQLGPNRIAPWRRPPSS